MSDYSVNSGSPTPPVPHGNPKADAKAAKAYAKASRPWFKKKRWWGVTAVIIVFGATAVGGGDGGGDVTPAAASDTGAEGATKSDNAAKSEPTKPKPKAEPKAKPVQVEAAAILKEFEENEAAADGKYKGKTLAVSGELNKVDTEMFDDSEYVARVGAGTDFDFITVNCNDQSSKDVASVKKGQDITVVGKFDDGGDLGVELKDCTIK